MGASDRALTNADRIEDYQDSLIARFFRRRLLTRTPAAVDIERGIDKVSVDGLAFAYRGRLMTVEEWQKWKDEITVTVASPKHPHPDTYRPETEKWPTMTALIYTIVENWPAKGASCKEQEKLVRHSTILQLAENAELIRGANEQGKYQRHTSCKSECEFVCVPVDIFPRETFQTVRGGAYDRSMAADIQRCSSPRPHRPGAGQGVVPKEQLHLFE